MRMMNGTWDCHGGVTCGYANREGEGEGSLTYCRGPTTQVTVLGGIPQGQEGFEAEDEVMETTAQEDLRGKSRWVVGNYVQRGNEWCEVCMDKERKVCWGEDGRGLRNHGVSEHSGASKGKAKAIARPSELEQGAAGPRCASTSAHPWLYPVPMTSMSKDVVDADLLQEAGRSMISNQILNAIVCNLGQLTTQGSFIEAQVQSLKARSMDLNIEVHDVQELQKKYFEQLEYIATQLGMLMCEAREFPVEDEPESTLEDSE
ncbi:hypothetical protein PAXINDRAFT_19367 [Paxillus involutus ATCC 200175]|uniref:Uncharacterized protein n=1 Tax=Paxillus involutus ATCC 200175 TaxID=664439 RepID=A0A0C9THF0_PAXIN|nr:hypothetical protein PAXINDRAFT_19367 [Paxillus involutus ATCC 200175]